MIKVRCLGLVLVACVGCEADVFTRMVDGAADAMLAPDAQGEEDGAIDASIEGSSHDSAGDVVLVDAVIDAPIIDAGPDALKCPTNGQGCSNIGQRICDDETHYWYCGGTWTRNDCVGGNPICAYGSDGGLYCKEAKCIP